MICLMKKKRIITSRIPLLDFPQQLVSYCSQRFTYLNHNQWQKEITAGKVSLNDRVVCDPATELSGGEMLAWDGRGIVEPEVDSEITILYEDEWLVATGISTAAIRTTALPASNARIAGMSICWPFPANAGISVHRAIRSGWWSSGSGSAWTYSRRSPTGILSSVSRRSCGDISYTTVNFLPI